MHNARIISEDIREILKEEIPWENFYKSTVLISGANGYVPAYFVHTFLALNDQRKADIHVIALCRSKERAQERFQMYQGRKDLEFKIQDVCDPIEYPGEIHYFIHGASPAGIRSRHADPVATFGANVTGCENMLKLAVQKDCRGFLLLSSVDVYGQVDHSGRLTEGDSGYLDSLNVRNAYALGKRAAETLAGIYHGKYGLPAKIARPFQIVGPGLDLDDGRLHIDFISQILREGRIVLKSDGRAKRSFLYITDAISGMLTVLLKGKAGEAYNVVDESGEADVLSLARLMGGLVREKNIPLEFDLEKRNTIEVTGALAAVTGSSEKLKKLGWKPRVSLVAGAARMMNYYGIETEREEKW